jgi:hypothetical protein
VTTYRIKTEQDRQHAIKMLQARELPCTAEFTKGLKKSHDQEKLARKWFKELEAQGDQEAEQYRGYCKLHFGVVLAKQHSDVWAEKYDRIIKPMPYEQKLEMMMEPFDFPVTRILSTALEKKYLDNVFQFYTGQGFVLTDPNFKLEAVA